MRTIPAGRLLGAGLFKLRQELYPGRFISFGVFISKMLRGIPRTQKLSSEVRVAKTMPLGPDHEATGDGKSRLCAVAAVSARQSDVKYDNTIN